MKLIPVRQIEVSQKREISEGRFSIRALQQVLRGDVVHHLHKHNFYFVLAVSEGAGLHEIDFVSYPVHSHSIFILRPGQVHRLELAAGSLGFLMEFDLSFYKPKDSIKEHRWRRVSTKNFCKVEEGRFKKLNAYLASIFDEYSNGQDGYLEAIQANLNLFFIENSRQSSNPASATKGENDYMKDRFEALLHLLETNITSKKNVTEYAEMFNLSTYQLNAITKKTVGKTVSNLINEQIILEAKRLLLATPHQVKDIAYNLGYEDISYFIRFFKKQTGQSPDAFRRNFK
ncbi:AraC family transcriptional regulator [Desertivirga brevis]|uniref:AraC family transcriptional regulator n=1 Tax=Desertivirga brevis TaxID=2810310 RepID=UPI001A973ADC|nr:AraC family transcriptional regulator [Pedobacter sp. SYSU D00873]